MKRSVRLYALILALLMLTSAALAEELSTPSDLGPAIHYDQPITKQEGFSAGFAVTHGQTEVYAGDGTLSAVAGGGFVVYVTGFNQQKASVAYAVDGVAVTDTWMKPDELYPITESALAAQLKLAEKKETVLLSNNKEKPLSVMPGSWLIISEPVEETVEEILAPVLSISTNITPADLKYGDTLIFTAHAEGLNDHEWTLTWQYSADGTEWDDIPGANAMTYQVAVDDSFVGGMWRFEVEVTD